MSYWKYQGEENNAPAIPGYRPGETVEFSLTFVNDTNEAFLNAYLYVTAEFEDMLEAKRSDEGTYRQIRQILDSEAYLGELPAGETEIDFRLTNNKYTEAGHFGIPIYLGHDDGAAAPSTLYCSAFFLWAQCWSQVVFWRNGYYCDIPDCEGTITGKGFNTDYEPGLFEDSYTPGLWG